MKHDSTRLPWSVLATRSVASGAVLWSLGCSSETEPRDGDESESIGLDTGCEAWRKASCAYQVRCGSATSSCSTQLGNVNCRSESAATQCASQLRDAECASAPVECGASFIADTAVAISGCNTYLRAVCSSAATCMLESSGDDCVAKQQVDCSHAIGLTASFVDCLSQLMDLDCKLWVPPDACAGVVLLR